MDSGDAVPPCGIKTVRFSYLSPKNFGNSTRQAGRLRYRNGSNHWKPSHGGINAFSKVWKNGAGWKPAVQFFSNVWKKKPLREPERRGVFPGVGKTGGGRA